VMWRYYGNLGERLTWLCMKGEISELVAHIEEFKTLQKSLNSRPFHYGAKHPLILALEASITNNQKECAKLIAFAMIELSVPLYIPPFSFSRSNNILRETIEYLILNVLEIAESPAVFANSRNEKGLTPLHYAAILNLPHALTKLIECGAIVRKDDELGRTALHWACLLGNTESVRILMKNGATRELQNTNGSFSPSLSPLALALGQKKFRSCKIAFRFRIELPNRDDGLRFSVKK